MEITNKLSVQVANYQDIGCENIFKGPSIGSYEEMVKRIPIEDRVKIESKLETLTQVDEHLEVIQKLLEKGKYHELEEDAFYYALLGLKEGKVKASVVIRISDIETLRKQGITFNVFDPLKKYQDPLELREFLYRATGKQLKGAMLERFIDSIKLLPKEDRYLMSFKPKASKLKTFVFEALRLEGYMPTVSQVIETGNKMNVFGKIKNPENPFETLRLFASLELFHLFLENRFGKEKVTPNPVFGISTPKQIEENGLTNTRDICHLYLVPDENWNNQLVTQDEADGFMCIENDFNQHDRYHAFVSSSIGKKDRQLSITIAKALEEHALKRKEQISKQDYKAMRYIHWFLIDTDYPAYYRKDEITVHFLVWSIFHPLFVADQFFHQTRRLENPTIPEEKKAEYKKSLPKLAFNYFQTRKILNETFAVIAANLPKDKNYQKSVHLWAKSQIEKNNSRIVLIQSAKPQTKREEDQLNKEINRIQTLTSSVKVIEHFAS